MEFSLKLFDLCYHLSKQHRSLIPEKCDLLDSNTNARNIGGTSDAQTPDSAISKPEPETSKHKYSSGKQKSSPRKQKSPTRGSSCENYEVKYQSVHVSGIRSTSSLTRQPSIETPTGLVRLSSSTGSEPVRLSSSESFRSEIGLVKLNAMPALEEDGDSSDDRDGPDEIAGKSKTKDKSKIKRSKQIRKEITDPTMVEIVVGVVNDEPKSEKGKCERLSEFVKRFFPCMQRKEVPDILVSNCSSAQLS